MTKNNIPYQSFCWVIGTTSFRTAKLNLKIEKQLVLLNEFYNTVARNADWDWNNALQEKYYNFMKEKDFLYGEAKRKDKDAREKTSGLVDIGLITSDRLITDAGKELLSITDKGDYNTDHVLNIANDSLVYLKQLIKTGISVNDKVVRPFLVTVKCILEVEYLTYDEFIYLLPLINDEVSYNHIVKNMVQYRDNKISLDEIIYKRLSSMENYQLALRMLKNNPVDEELICLIGMNRKSRKYDKPYFELYRQLKNIFVDGGTDYEQLLISAKKITYRPGNMWRKLLFRTTNISVIRRMGEEAISPECPFLWCNGEADLKEQFFKYLHIFKAKSTLEDYFDLNRRYFNLTDILIFEDRTIKLDILPKYYFAEVMDKLCLEMFTECDKLVSSTSLKDISSAFDVDIKTVYSALSRALGIRINTASQVAAYISDERYRRFNNLIDKKFSDEVLIELLSCFESRNDSRIEELVTDEATIPTIFEYILGIIWYKVSERQGNILDYMKLSLEANLLPKTHAAGGNADIVYQYDACAYYPKHDLLIEATLSEKDNQRRMEMEPVSRHLGDYRIKSDNPFDYSVFISTYLDPNVVSDFRCRKVYTYTKAGKRIDGLKILSLDTSCLKKMIENKVYYKHLYKVFDDFYNMPLDTLDWHDEMIKQTIGKYRSS